MHRLIVVIPVGQADAANALAQTIDPDAGRGNRTFVFSLNASGDPTAPTTHLWCSWLLTDAQRIGLEDLVSRIPGAEFAAYDLDRQAQLAQTWAAGKGLVARRPALEIAAAVEK